MSVSMVQVGLFLTAGVLLVLLLARRRKRKAIR